MQTSIAHSLTRSSPPLGHVAPATGPAAYARVVDDDVRPPCRWPLAKRAPPPSVSSTSLTDAGPGPRPRPPAIPPSAPAPRCSGARQGLLHGLAIPDEVAGDRRHAARQRPVPMAGSYRGSLRSCLRHRRSVSLGFRPGLHGAEQPSVVPSDNRCPSRRCGGVHPKPRSLVPEMSRPRHPPNHPSARSRGAPAEPGSRAELQSPPP